MTSATGKPGRPRGGFTLLEIVLVLGLIAVAGSIVVANFSSMASRDGQLSTEETLRTAIRQARFKAASQRSEIGLRFDKEQGALVLSDETRFALNENFGPAGRGHIRFYLIPPAEGLSPWRDERSAQLETEAVIFAPDRSSSPFAVQIDTGSGTPQLQRYDPFSGLPRKPAN